MKINITPGTLASLSFDNRFTRELPSDPIDTNHRRQVVGACYSRVQPIKVSAPRTVAYSREAATLIDLSTETCESPEFADVFSGNRLLDGMDPHAVCYGGHQFGNWAGQLGDGRAINLGEIVNQKSERWVLQLKGAGPTPYARNADGLAVLRSSIREFLCSEAMFHLGVPTTRALSIIATGHSVERDMFYDGHTKEEPGAVVCRLAPSFLRFGNFEIFASRGDMKILKQLLDYAIRTDFSHLGEPSVPVYEKWFEEVCRRTADLMVEWMRVGFVHGVMNTDNMSILGLTIDYGPYGWLENYDPDWTPNTTDAAGRRYRFSYQARIAHWNLHQLANAIYPLIEKADPLENALNLYIERYQQGWHDMMAGKLGLKHFEAHADTQLLGELLAVLTVIETDMTIFFRNLATLKIETFESLDDTSNQTLMAPLMDAYYLPTQITVEYQAALGHWLREYIRRVQRDNLSPEAWREKMNSVNPKYVLRNYLAQLAIDKAETGDYSMVGELLELLRHPYADQPGKEKFAGKRPEWARHRAGCSMLSCSS